MNACVTKKRQIQSIQPDHRSIALVAMIVPMPRRRDNNITTLKCHLLALYSRKTLAINDEARCKGDVSVCNSSFTRVDNLKAAVDGISCVWACF